jgi:protein tyrosine phosphatase (PTP) superfamily phosphohydrolase (DUF442 family)
MVRVFPVLCLFALAGCGKPPPAPKPPEFEPQKVESPAGLHNLIKVNDWLYTGSEPEEEAGFQSLAALGIRTIVTVDGARPDLSLAKKHDMRYVHFPIGYNAIPQDRVLQIAKALQTLPRPIYLHCHHGKHRGPAAAVAALRCLDGTCTAAKAVEFMKLAGTDPRYAELFASVEAQSTVERDALDRVPNDFPLSVTVSDFATTMVKIDTVWSRLQKTNEEKDAILLHEHYRELLRHPDGQSKGLNDLLKQAEAESKLLLEAKDPAARERAIAANGQLCNQCHKAFRDQSRPKQQ